MVDLGSGVEGSWLWAIVASGVATGKGKVEIAGGFFAEWSAGSWKWYPSVLQGVFRGKDLVKIE